MRNEVGEKACGFREVLGRLVWDGECECEVVFILNRLYENSALFVHYSVRNVKTGNKLAYLLLVLGPRVICDKRSCNEPTVGDRGE